MNSPKLHRTLTLAGLIVLAAGASLVSRPTKAQVVYQPAGCEYRVTFPGEPKRTTGFQPGFGEYIKAEYIAKGTAYFVRAECFVVGARGELNLSGKATYRT